MSSQARILQLCLSLSPAVCSTKFREVKIMLFILCSLSTKPSMLHYSFLWYTLPVGLASATKRLPSGIVVFMAWPHNDTQPAKLITPVCLCGLPLLCVLHQTTGKISSVWTAHNVTNFETFKTGFKTYLFQIIGGLSSYCIYLSLPQPFILFLVLLAMCAAVLFILLLFSLMNEVH